MLRSPFSQTQMHIENVRKVGMMGGWPNQSNLAGWRTQVPSRGFAHCNVSRGCSVIRVLDSSPWSAGDKNRSVAAAERPIAAGTTEGIGECGVCLAPITRFTPSWRCVESTASGVTR